ncbi:MAG: hypothetical protein BAJALOKI2v1_170034 [Promethearchaeota archaeon]|nr:MAG: hypothetical protein BAJALOKI2v1_170034 [Candidatus Lokiarchaeota archaeon]
MTKEKPPSPILPPDKKIKKNFCLLHKGELSSETYKCPSCGTLYCLECAEKAKKQKIKCVKCKQMIFLP